MGKRGPPPTPTAVKRLKGTDRADRAAPNEMQPTLGIPECPAYLTAAARAEWNRIVPELAAVGVLSCIDGAALEGYCVNYALAVRYQKSADRRPMVDHRLRGKVPNPAALAARQHWLLAKAYAHEFGLTPSARTRVSVPKKPDADDPLGGFLFGDLKALPGGKAAGGDGSGA